MHYKTALSNEVSYPQNIFLRIILFSIILIWSTGFFFIPLFPSTILSSAYPFLKHIYSLVCHQQEYKSFSLNGIHFFVCARCTGIYFGAILTAFIFLFVKKRVKINLGSLLMSILPMIIDVILYSSGVYKYIKTLAFSTGIFSGSLVFIYILNTLEKFKSEIKINE